MPRRLRSLLDVPAEWKFIGYFCLGYPQADDTDPGARAERMGTATLAVVVSSGVNFKLLTISRLSQCVFD